MCVRVPPLLGAFIGPFLVPFLGAFFDLLGEYERGRARVLLGVGAQDPRAEEDRTAVVFHAWHTQVKLGGGGGRKGTVNFRGGCGGSGPWISLPLLPPVIALALPVCFPHGFAPCATFLSSCSFRRPPPPVESWRGLRPICPRGRCAVCAPTSSAR